MILYAEKLKLKAASEYNYLNQSNCLTIDRIDDSQKFHKLMVTPSVSCDFLCFRGTKCHIFFCNFLFCQRWLCYCRKLSTLFRFLKNIKNVHQHCLQLYYGQGMYLLKSLTMKTMWTWQQMKVEYIVLSSIMVNYWTNDAYYFPLAYCSCQLC